MSNTKLIISNKPEDEGGYSGGGGRFANNVDPGLPPGAQCEGSTDSKKYKKEHKKLCHEIESKPWEPVEAYCFLFSAGFCNAFEKIKTVESH